jgi:prepilin-type processing-associated H-X9-DG protein
VSQTHAPFGTTPPKKTVDVINHSGIVQFAEVAEAGSYAGADHLHVETFQLAAAPSPDVTIARIRQQMPLGRHGGGDGWEAILNYAFLDGHAESLPINSVYESPAKNRFNPAADH